jgi:hypothetical protein
MKTKLFVTSLFVSCALCSFAQAQENETKNFKQDIGFNTTFLLGGIFNSSSTPFSIMYKKYSSENKALRFGVSAVLDRKDFTDKAATSNYNNSDQYDFSLSIGKEFQKNITDKWIWYSGGDIVPSFSYHATDYFSGVTKTYAYKTTYIGLALRPFLGIRYNINSRLYLSAEASLQAKYSYGKEYETYAPNNTVQTDARGSRISLSLSPASGLFLFYRF